MQILRIAVGNAKEAFVETKFNEKINLILSNENNRGKTIVFQSLMYALGNEPIFPKGFMIDEYFYFCEFENKNIKYQIVRKKNVFTIRTDATLSYYVSVEEFRNWFDKNIYVLPRFRNEKGITKTDLPLFYQLFFLPQDKRNTSNIINPGYRKKKDFISLVEAMLYPETDDSDYLLISELINKKKQLETELESLIKKDSFIQKNKPLATTIFSSVDKIEAENIKQQINELNISISNIKNKIRKEENRKSKLISLLTELRSVNKFINEGSLLCAECGSDKIVFNIEDSTFDLTNDFVRKQIIESIQAKIDDKSQICDDLSSEQYVLEDKLKELIISQPQDISDFLLYKNEIEKVDSNNKLIKEKSDKIKILTNQIDEINDKESKRSKSLKEKYEQLLFLMREIVRKIDSNSAVFIDDLFTKNRENFSGSDSSIFYFAKLISLNKFLKLPFPIIIDAFREGELSSDREEIMLKEFSLISNQIIISATLKNEEYDVEKYKKYPNVNVLDYSDVQDSKLLNENFLSDFLSILSDFGIKI